MDGRPMIIGTAVGITQKGRKAETVELVIGSVMDTAKRTYSLIMIFFVPSASVTLLE
jgi:hypothetical protein